jgi:hypothetical protein
MSKLHVVTMGCASVLAVFAWAAVAADEARPDANAEVASVVAKEYDLGRPRSQGPQYYKQETRVVSVAADGTRTLTCLHRLYLSYQPEGAAGRYVCRKFTVQTGTGPEVRIPALDGWSYVFVPGIDDKGQVFGIELAKFQGLVDANGAPVPPDISYHVYNAFIDFHAFCNVFAEPSAPGAGIQDLKTIGQRIVHAAAHSVGPVNLPGSSEPGSQFTNGEVTLEFKGLSVVDGAPCALVGYDSGDSSFQILMKPAPGVEVKAVGASHYRGDIYVDLASRWVRKADMIEMVVMKTTMGDKELTGGTIERTLTIKSMGEEEFDKHSAP